VPAFRPTVARAISCATAASPSRRRRDDELTAGGPSGDARGAGSHRINAAFVAAFALPEAIEALAKHENVPATPEAVAGYSKIEHAPCAKITHRAGVMLE
jgi:hypothetical protein